MTPMPTARGEFGIAVVNGKIYAIGGLNGNDLPVSTTEEYNPITNEWTSMMPMPTPRSDFAIAVYQNKIYVIGGTVGNGFVGNNEVYNPVTNTWETKASMPTPRADLSATVVDDKIYLIGGKIYSNTDPFYTETNINEVYYPENDSWSTRTHIPTAVQGYASAVLDGKIYVMGGSIQASSGSSHATGTNQVYDPENDSWSLAANLPNVKSYSAAAATEGFMAPERIYLIGGLSSGQYSSEVQAYNPANNTWSLVEPMPTAQAYLSVAVVNDVLYAIGGFDGTNWLNVNEQYKPLGYGTMAPKVQITSPEDNKTYSNVTLAFTVNRGTAWMGYSLDSQANVTITGETKLSGLLEGANNITIYANDSLGNMGSSNTVFFSIDTIPPDIGMILPKNQTYGSSDIQLTFTLNEAVSNLAYSLDGQENITIIGNVTLPALSNGSHRLTLYATDNLGNSAEKTVFFNIEPFPIVTVAAVLAITIIAVSGGYLLFKRKKPSVDKEKLKEGKAD
jgi:N-acetylneuraminic acid mutarotase